jgi:hypothetical protein
MHRLVAVLVIALLGIAVAVTGASADGAGSPGGGCDGGPSVSGGSYTAPDGYVVDGVCIKSGQLHTDVINTAEDGCYNIDGLGTGSVTVTKDFDGPDCQDVSHLDIILSTCGSECEPCEGEQCEPCEGEQCEPPEDPCELDPPSCVPLELVCVDGNLVEAPANQATNDCGFINVCIGGANGEVERVSEFDAAQQGLEEGECEREDPPEDPGDPEPEVEEVVEEVAAVQDVAPIEEVAALPAAGLGNGSDSTSLLWVALLGTLLVGLGASTVLAARSRR